MRRINQDEKQESALPVLLILNQMAGSLTWEIAEDLADELGDVALFTGDPDTLQKQHPRVATYVASPYHRSTLWRRALTWVRYWIQSFIWLWRWPKSAPLLLFSNPPMLIWLGWLMKKLRGIQYSIMVYDVYPDVLVNVGGFSETSWLVRVWRVLNRYAYENADVVMTLGEFMGQKLEAQFDSTQTPAGQIALIYPWADVDKIKPLPKDENPFAIQHAQVDKITVMYSGNMGLGHDIETMIEAARGLKDDSRIHFMFIGAGPKWRMIEELLLVEDLPNVSLLGWQPEGVVPYSLATADIALVTLEDEMQGLAVPSKTVSAMAAGSAIVAVAGKNNELYGWLKRFGCGVVVSPKDVHGLQEVIKHFASNPRILKVARKNARRASEKHFDRNIRSASLLQLITMMTSTSDLKL